jgi:hypothetical protein
VGRGKDEEAEEEVGEGEVVEVEVYSERRGCSPGGRQGAQVSWRMLRVRTE